MALKEHKPGQAFPGVIGRTFDVFALVRRLTTCKLAGLSC